MCKKISLIDNINEPFASLVETRKVVNRDLSQSNIEKMKQ